MKVEIKVKIGEAPERGLQADVPPDMDAKQCLTIVFENLMLSIFGKDGG